MDIGLRRLNVHKEDNSDITTATNTTATTTIATTTTTITTTTATTTTTTTTVAQYGEMCKLLNSQFQNTVPARKYTFTQVASTIQGKRMEHAAFHTGCRWRHVDTRNSLLTVLRKVSWMQICFL